jgi:hypothetical protein
MKKACLIISLCALCCTGRAGTNDYISTFTGEETDRRLGVVIDTELIVSNLNIAVAGFTNNTKTAVYSGGLADVGFINAVISAAFTNANFITNNLSAYVGTNVALVTLQFKGIAASTVSLRTAGDTNTVDDTSINSVAIAAGSTANMTCLTDSAGCVEVKATGNTSMTLINFIRRHVFE